MTCWLFLLLACVAVAQSPLEHGDRKWRKKGVHNGNLVRTLYFNWGEVAHWPDQPSVEWPKGSGNSYVDGVSVLVGAEVAGQNGDTLHLIEAGYRELMQISPDGIEYGWQPVPGYANFAQDSPAMSDRPFTWPKFWPDKPPEWSGFWNGYFGQKTSADQESYFVFDDALDKRFAFQPSPARDPSRGGLGMQVRARGLQWTHVLAEDVIFWVFDITNVSEQDYTKVYFGMYIDSGVGGPNDSLDDNGFYDTKIDIAYAWDNDFTGQTGFVGKPGYVGYAFLESPGNPFDGIDNDEDGLIDERRDDGLDNDGDWRPYSDFNENGKWDEGEPLNDDVGADGLGPLDREYRGPDRGEADGVPTAGEPHFDATDLDESDQIGLTSVDLIVAGLSGDVTFETVGAEDLWRRMSAGHFDTEPHLNVNSGLIYASGPFPMPAGHTERFSMALVVGEDLNDLKRNKNTVQLIYNANYNFARPPDKPTLNVIPGDKKVTLYWDRRAEESVDFFLADSAGNPRKDFEGYRIYRATDPNFLENRIITDAFGNPIFRKPMAQFDLVNGLKGPHPIGVNGAQFDMGTDSGLQHAWVDTTVENGQTYYYALVSYDQGDVQIGLAPSECASVIETDVAGNIRTDINTAVVTPNAPAAGYRPPEVRGGVLHAAGPGTGRIDVEFFDPNAIKDGRRYRVTFDDSTFLRQTTSYSVFDWNSNPPTTVIDKSRFVGYDELGRPEEGPLFDGMRVRIYNDTTGYDQKTSTWLPGARTNFTVAGGLSSEGIPGRRVVFPADYEIRFFDHIVDTSSAFGGPALPANFEVWNITDNLKVDFFFFDFDKDGAVTNGDKVIPLFYLFGDSVANSGGRREYRMAWEAKFVAPASGNSIPPQPGDIFWMHCTKPFRSADVFEFETRAAYVDNALAKSELNRIAVVPNPYVGAASWEPANRFRSGRGERKIDFIHLPAQCTIRIYTISGVLVDTIEHNAPAADGAVSWNLVSKDGMDIAYGVYLYHIAAPAVGEKMGKFAVIK